MKWTPDADRPVPSNPFDRPGFPMSSAENEFLRRSRENAEYRAQIRDTQAVRAKHLPEQPVAPQPKPEQLDAPERIGLLHAWWLTLLRGIAGIKRRFDS